MYDQSSNVLQEWQPPMEQESYHKVRNPQALAVGSISKSHISCSQETSGSQPEACPSFARSEPD